MRQENEEEGIEEGNKLLGLTQALKCKYELGEWTLRVLNGDGEERREGEVGGYGKNKERERRMKVRKECPSR